MLSRELEKTLHRSLSLANERRHEYSTLEHLLFALIDDIDAATVLRACGVDLDKLRSDLLEFLDKDLAGLATDRPGDPKPTAGFQRVVQRAAIHVQSSGRDEVTGANVLVALFSERDSHAFYFLQLQDMTRLDAVNFMLHGITRPRTGFEGRQQESSDTSPLRPERSERPRQRRKAVSARERPERTPKLQSNIPEASPSSTETPVQKRPKANKRTVERQRGEPQASNGKVAAGPSFPVSCSFGAVMDENIELGKLVSVEVTVSRAEIEIAAGPTAKSARGAVDASRHLVVQLIGKTNIDVRGDSRVEIDVPEAGEGAVLYFDVRGTHSGSGELWVVVRQGAKPLATLVLQPVIHAAGETADTRRVSAVLTAEFSSPGEALPLLLIYERQDGARTWYQFTFDLHGLPGGRVLTCESRHIVGDRGRYVRSLYKRLEDRWPVGSQAVSEFFEELRELGATLLDELLPLELQRLLWTHRNDLRGNIVVVSEEPFIPWEMLYLKKLPLGGERATLSQDGEFFGQMGMTRWLHNPPWPPKSIQIRRGRSFYLAPKYSGNLELPNAALETDFVARAFGAQEAAPDLTTLRAMLQSPSGFDLLHFCGHGIADADELGSADILLSESPGGARRTLSSFTIDQIESLADADGNRPLIVFNACEIGRIALRLTGIGGFAQAFVKAQVGAFVGTLWSVGDEPARVFTEELYRGLRSNVPLGTAAAAAREKARVAGDATWLAYVVYGHPQMTVALQPSITYKVLELAK